MDPETALSMEALEMEKMRKNRNSPSVPQVTGTTRNSSAGTNSSNLTGTGTKPHHNLDADLISFFESPPPAQNQWSLFESQPNSSANSAIGSSNNFSSGFHPHPLPQLQTVWPRQTQSKSLTLEPPHMSQTGSNILLGPSDLTGQYGNKTQPAQNPRLVHPSVNPFKDNFTPDMTLHQYPLSHNSSPSELVATLPAAIDSSIIEPSSSVSYHGESERSRADEVNNVFEMWLNESSNGRVHLDKPLTSIPSPSFNLKEWDPLLIHSDSVETIPLPVLADDSKKDSQVSSSQPQQVMDSQDDSYHVSGSSSMQDTQKVQLLNAVIRIHSTFPLNDPLSNPGYLISPMMPNWQCVETEDKDIGTVKVSITTEESDEPVVFTCNIDASVEHIVSQALCIAHEDISQITTSDYRFRVRGRQEFLISDTPLRIYEYVQDCIKFDEDVSLQLVHKDAMNRTLIRTESDMDREKLKSDLLQTMSGDLSWESIHIAKDAYLTEIEKLCTSSETMKYTASQQCDRVHQTVKAIIQLLGGIELKDVAHAMMKLKITVEKDFSNPVRQDVYNADGSSSLTPTSAIITSSTSMTRQDHISIAVENLSTSLLQFIDMYAKAIELEHEEPTVSPTAISCNVQDLLTLNIVSVHRLAQMWSSMYDEFYVSCQLVYGNQELMTSVKTKVVKAVLSWKYRVTWDGWLTFPMKVCELPRETKLCLTLHGYPVGRDNSKPEKNTAKELAWTNVAIFDHRGILQQGSALYGMWSAANMSTQLRTSSLCSSSISNPESTVICVQLLSTQNSKSIIFPPYSLQFQLPKNLPNSVSLASLDESTQQDLCHIMNKNPMARLADHEKDLLWKHRCVQEYVSSRGSLARILRSVPAWSPKYLDTIYLLLKTWPSIEPIEAFELLSISFPDVHVRRFAIRCLRQATEDEIHDYLVQLTQALKYEMFHDSNLFEFLLRSAIGSLRIAHKLYWLLSENMDTPWIAERYRVVLSAIELAGGARLRKEFSKESYLVKLINRAAESVKYAKDANRNSVLQSELEKVQARVKNQSFRLPSNPALVANGIDISNSSYFTSNAIPLRLAFNNVEKIPKHIHLMFKVGDDLRQDVLTMQLVTIMDKLWLSEGLDLKMVTFSCLSTGKDRGFIELVSDSITLREIQSSYGLTGAFKDRPIAEWLQKHNPTANAYEKVEENFTLSCAGYCVATYVLGICDRHNDNIMLRKSGHLFHIDFARFLGHAQMFGNIKRDRAPFVLTSDMAYVINGGDRQSSRFHDFVDICCRAFNIIRKNYHIFINLLSLMIHSGIPELKSTSDLKYVYDALKPAATEEEATTMFTRLIEASLSSSFTRINFFIHNLAQMRFLGNENADKSSLSFSAKTHSAKEDGYLSEAVVVGYNKKYNPEKYYIFCIRLKRDMRSGESYVYRTYNEFAELHQKLCLSFPPHKIPSFPSKVFVGRSQVKQVAERRKVQLNAYLHSLLRDHLDISRSDLIYTFFHPMLRDEQGGNVKASTSQESPDGNDPDPYVKTKLLPDINRSTKRKTKVARKTLHPTFNEMLIYEIELEALASRKLFVSVWNYEQLNENDFLGSVTLDLGQMDLHQDNTAWYPLTPSIM